MARILRLTTCLMVLVVAAPVHAQVTTGQISGTVRDATGGVLQNTEVVILNQDTGISRTLKSDEQGYYEAPNLPLGKYELVFTLTGFRTEMRSGVTLTIGRNIVINVTMEPGAVADEVTVIGEAPLIDTTSSQVGALVSREQIRDLPLNGRDYTQLALLQPGVVGYREQSRELNRGMGTRFSISGARHNQVGFRLNGIDIADAAGTTPGSATGHNLGVDAIQEFQVLTNTFTAEQGKSAGGIVNIVHKSGTNEFHGSAFEYHRNSAFDARNFFDLGDDPAPFKRNQFGVSGGGPILRNRTFFFGAYEGLRERLDLTGINNVFTPEFKAGAFGAVDSRIKPYLDVMPNPNGRIFNDGTGELLTLVNTQSKEHYVVTRGDYTFSPSTSFSVSYTFDDGEVSAPEPRSGIPTFTTASNNRFQYFTAQATHIFSPSLLLSVRGGFNKSNVDATRIPLIDLPSGLEFVPNTSALSIEVGAIGAYSLVFEPVLDRKIVLNNWQVANTLTWVRGSHSFKAGMEAYRMEVSNTTASRTYGGRYQFASYADLRAARATLFQADDPDADKFPTIRQELFGFFLQDDFRVTSQLTVNAGLRYEFITTPRSTRVNQATLVNLTDPQLTLDDTFFKNPSLKNFAPRVGVAWDVFGNQRSAIRGGFGLYHDQITSYYYLPVIESNPPFNLTRTVNSPPFPNAYAQIASGAVPSLFSLQTLQYDLDQPYRIQYNIGFQQELPGSMALAVYYVGGRDHNLTQFFLNANSTTPAGTTADGRPFFRATDPPINPAFGVIQRRVTRGEGWYDSLQVLVQRRPRGGLSFQGSYTLQDNEDTGSISSFSSEGLNTVSQQSLFLPPDTEKGLSSYHVRHTFTMNANYDLPTPSGWTGIAKVLAAGWQLSTVATLASGHPFTAILSFDNANVRTRSRGDHLRPDLAPGANANPVDPGNVLQYFDPTAFVLPPAGTLGTLPRNTLIGPGFATVDFSIKKRVSLVGSTRAEFRVETFNLFNRANFRIPEDANRQVLSRGGVYNPNAGRITSTTSPARQIQLSARFEF